MSRFSACQPLKQNATDGAQAKNDYPATAAEARSNDSRGRPPDASTSHQAVSCPSDKVKTAMMINPVTT
jgi:hypothetical protein